MAGISSYIRQIFTGSASGTQEKRAAAQLTNGPWADAVILVDADGNPVSAGGGGGTANGLTDTQLRAAPLKTTAQVAGAEVSEDNPTPVRSGKILNVTTTLVSGQSLTPAIDLGIGRLARLVIPAGWTAADVTFQTSYDGAAWSDLYDASGNVYTVKAAAGRAILLPLADFLSMGRLKIRSGTPTAPVAQAADRALTLVLVP